MTVAAARILIVDDMEANRDILNDLLITSGYTPILAENGSLAMAEIKKQPPDIVLLDIMMPVMDGYEVLDRIKSDSDLRHIPVIMISAFDETESVVRCIRNGAEDYLIKPFNPTLLNARISSCLERKRMHDREQEYLIKIEGYNKNLKKIVREQVEEIAAGQMSTIFAMAKLAESRDPETGEHLLRMREYVKIVAQKLQRVSRYTQTINDDFIKNIFEAAPLHDIGKVGVADKILLKPGRLLQEEFDLMKQHTTIGANQLREVYQQHPKNDFVRIGIEIAGSHHEKWDGNGYPLGLVGEKIPLAGRILAIGDVYDALTSKRVYKDAYSHEKSKKIILKDSGGHFDPDIVEAFVAAEYEFIDIYKRYAD
ncbi:response regulator [Desulfobacterales bacterium HSG16]|nr:response regulator [Desulfobacterales bacterium HSG16]